jgi:hypothetical protein
LIVREFITQDHIDRITAEEVGAIPSPVTANVGETIVISKVDENGKPTEWMTAPMESGGGGTGNGNAVLFIPQNLTPEQQAQARENIGVVASPETATVGQTIVVKEVDENGKPTQWEAADFPSGGGGGKEWRHTHSIVLSERVTAVEIYEDENGDPLSCTEILAYIKTAYICPDAPDLTSPQKLLAVINGAYPEDLGNVVRNDSPSTFCSCYVNSNVGAVAILDAATIQTLLGVRMRNVMGGYASQNIRSFALKMQYHNRLMVEGSTIEIFMR